MLPAPARMAAAPRPKRAGSRSPAVPPPPVSGAPAGTGLAGRSPDADDDGLGVVGPALPVAGVVSGGVLPAELLTVAEPLDPGENVGGDADGEDPEQAATEADAIMATLAQLAAVTRARSPVPALFMGILMESPHAGVRPRRARTGKWPAHH
jgi:hypothetical protein